MTKSTIRSHFMSRNDFVQKYATSKKLHTFDFWATQCTLLYIY